MVDMGGTSGACGAEEKFMEDFGNKPERKRT
jgi:hypothetical protein